MCPCDCFNAREECLISVQDLCSEEKSSKPSKKSIVRRFSLSGSSSKTKVANFPTSADSYRDVVCPAPGHNGNHLSPQQYAIWFCGSEVKQKHLVKNTEVNENSPDEIFLEYSQRIVSEDILFTVDIKLGLVFTDVKAVRTNNPSDIKLAGLAMLKEWQGKTGLTETTQITALLKSAFGGEESRKSIPGTNEIESMLWACSRRIVTQDLLFGIGVTIDLPYSEIESTLTNNQADIQLAAFRMLVKGQLMKNWSENRLKDKLNKGFQQYGIMDIFG